MISIYYIKNTTLYAIIKQWSDIKMNINDYFKSDSSYIIKNFNVIDFDENERSLAKFLKDSIDYFLFHNNLCCIY